MARSRNVKIDPAGLLDATTVPTYLLDENRRIVYCNTAFSDWVGRDRRELVGLQCDYHSGDDVDPLQAIGAGVCPPVEVFSGRQVRAIVECDDPTGQRVRRRGDFLPLGRDPLDCAGVVAVLDAEDLPPGERAAGAPEVEEPHADQLHERIRAFRNQQRRQYRIDRLVGDSPAAKRAQAQVALAMGSRSHILVVGPKGSGREHLARTLHYGGPQESAPPLVPMNCELLDADLLRTTVTAFVHRCAELATEQPPALLLLEVDQLDREAQAELAGFLKIAELDLYAIATARRPLIDLAETDQFRHDLACQLSTLVVELPPLSDRREDIPLLAQFFVEQINAQGKVQRSGFTDEALDRLAAYPWPGNVDELAEMVAQAHRQAEGPMIAASELPQRIGLAADAAAHPHVEEEPIVLTDFLNQVETELIQRALTKAKGNKTKTAKLLGMNRARLLRRLAQLGLADKGGPEES